MGDNIVSEDRPAKRIKLSSQPHHQQPHPLRNYHVVTSPTNMNVIAAAGHAHATMPIPASVQIQTQSQARAQAAADPWATPGGRFFDDSWGWPETSQTAPSPTISPTSAMLITMPRPNEPNTATTSMWAPETTIASTTLISSSTPVEFDVSPTTAFHHGIAEIPNYSQSRFPRLLPAVPDELPPESSLPPRQEQRRRKTRSRPSLISPFKDCLDKFGDVSGPRYPRPIDGKVNGYIKFNWPKEAGVRESSVFKDRSDSIHRITELSDSGEDSQTSQTPQSITFTPPTTSTTLIPAGSSTSLKSPATTVDDASDLTVDQSCIQYSSRSFRSPRSSISPSIASSSPVLLQANAPRLIPHLFGFQAQMDNTDRRFWSFYVNNWCPGRSVLRNTNLWLNDFAQMEESDGVRAAIQSLAGIYIYDYQPMDAIRKRVNERFSDAESRLSFLLNDPTSLTKAQAGELITIATILSMQDIVLTERRLQKPYNPRWLQGFKQAEHVLHMFDEGARFWKSDNVQLGSLEVSQSIIVGRAVILAQPMVALPSPATFDPEQEASRFGWLSYGSQGDMYQIHGGCGFSKKLLHVMSQITYCAARLQQDRDTPIVPLTARYLFEELMEMRQWNSESNTWLDAKQSPPVIDWVCKIPAGHIINSSNDMTDATAEAWRFAAIIYLQCRLLRLPRNHPNVLENLGHLASCIRIMPTSGVHFTAQAPLFPIFLLGLLASFQEHKMVAQNWFEQVVGTPVRSSVPPLYQALERIWSWLDTEIELPPPGYIELPESIGMRRAWWERMVARVHEKETETLCLT